MEKPKRKFYAVGVGRKTGVFASWAECEAQVKKFSGAKFKSFPTRQQAQDFVQRCQRVSSHVVVPPPPPSAGVKRPKRTRNAADGGTTDTGANTDEKKNDSPARKKAFVPSSQQPPRTTSEAETWRISIMFDGGSRGNPGCGGAGAVVRIVAKTDNVDNNTPSIYKTIRIRHYLGKCTNNEAEYCGLSQGLGAVLEELQKASTTATATHKVYVNIQGDSQLVINQVTGVYQCKRPNLKVCLEKVQRLVAAIERSVASIKIEFQHVLRAQNAVADGLANQAMDAKQSWTTVEEEKGADT